MNGLTGKVGMQDVDLSQVLGANEVLTLDTLATRRKWSSPA